MSVVPGEILEKFHVAQHELSKRPGENQDKTLDLAGLAGVRVFVLQSSL